MLKGKLSSKQIALTRGGGTSMRSWGAGPARSAWDGSPQACPGHGERRQLAVRDRHHLEPLGTGETSAGRGRTGRTGGEKRRKRWHTVRDGWGAATPYPGGEAGMTSGESGSPSGAQPKRQATHDATEECVKDPQGEVQGNRMAVGLDASSRSPEKKIKSSWEANFRGFGGGNLPKPLKTPFFGHSDPHFL